jgi:hypothetical protein
LFSNENKVQLPRRKRDTTGDIISEGYSIIEHQRRIYPEEKRVYVVWYIGSRIQSPKRAWLKGQPGMIDAVIEITRFEKMVDMIKIGGVPQ